MAASGTKLHVHEHDVIGAVRFGHDVTHAVDHVAPAHESDLFGGEQRLEAVHLVRARDADVLRDESRHVFRQPTVGIELERAQDCVVER
jgi:hypothetical protein